MPPLKLRGGFSFPFIKILLIILTALLIATSGCRSDQGKDTAIYKEGEVLVSFKSGTGLQKRIRLHKAIGSIPISYYRRLIDFDRVRLSAGMKVEDAIKMYMDNPDVEYAEPNYIVHKAMIPDDTYFDLQWGLYNIGQAINPANGYQYSGIDDADIDMTDAWDIVSSVTVIDRPVIAVIDTGVDYTHIELRDNIWENPGEVADNGIDDDGNGKIDDTIGWNFAANKKDPMDDDVDGHGTHVAGIIGAVGNNGTGIAGINWNARIMPLKFLDSLGNGTIADAVEAIDYAVSMGAKVINASYTYPNKCSKTSPSKTERSAISEAGRHGVILVAAAGNYHCNNDNTPLYPAGHDLSNIISVAAINADDEPASWSNYGAKSVHVAAPGEDIYSTVPADKGSYAYMSGTSSASPFVAGLAGLVSSLHPEYSGLEIKEAILASVDVLKSLDGKVITGGKINAYKALTYTGEPAAPSAVLLKVVSGSEIDISWSDNSYKEDGFIIERKRGDTGDYTPVIPTTGGVNTNFYSDTALDDGTLYYYRVRAYNKNGYSLYSGEVEAITRLNPPSGLSLLMTPDSGININWVDNSISEDGFLIERREGNESSYNEIIGVNRDSISYNDSNVKPGSTYYYRVKAVSSIAGYSAYSNEVDLTTPGVSNPETAGNNSETNTDASVKKSSKDPRCFIATAAYGSYLHPRVQVLRNFRDRYLITNPVGQKFIELYYTISPPIAGMISRHEYLREATRILLSPLITIIEIIME